MKRLLIYALTLCLVALTACGQEQGGSTEPADSQAPPAESDAAADSALPAYLTELADWERALEMEPVLTRDDLDIRITPSPSLVSTLAGCLLDMGLTPGGKAQASLEVAHPFTLTFRADGKEEAISVSEKAVTLSGRDYTPSNPGALSALYLDNERFLTGDVFLLEETIPFTAAGVTEIRLEEYENYSDGVTKVTTTDREVIDRIVQGLSESVARRFEPGEEPGMFVGVGGNGFFCTLVTEGGGEWSINPRGLTKITSAGGEEEVLVLSMDHEAVFGLLDSGDAVPVLRADIGDMAPTVYEKAYQADQQQKSMSHIVPVGMLFGNDPVLPPQEAYSCRLEWADATGNAVTPTGVTATLYEETADPMQPVDGGTALQTDGGTLTLPGGDGKRYVVVRAQLQGDSWVESIFSYRSSIFPTSFFDIGYGNDEGGVTLTRTGADVTVTGTQNRKYVDFALSLELRPSTGEPQSLPVREPFTLTYSDGKTTQPLTLTKDGASFGGQAYTVGNPQAIEELYAPFDIEDMNMFERVNYNLRGFLTKEVAYFVDEFPLDPEQIEKITIIREEPEQRVLHDMEAMDPREISEILGYVVLGKDWQTEDYYALRRFYLSYQLVLQDGTTYEIGERILKNGEDTGWYTIQSDSPAAAALVEGRAGAVERREIPVHGSIGMDDQGNIIID